MIILLNTKNRRAVNKLFKTSAFSKMFSNKMFSIKMFSKKVFSSKLSNNIKLLNITKARNNITNNKVLS